MPQLGPHISISDAQLLTKVLGLVDLERFTHWPEDVKTLAWDLCAELFLVRYNPFVAPELVRESVWRRLNMAKPNLSGDYSKILTAAVEEFWNTWEEDQIFKVRVQERLAALLPRNAVSDEPHTLVESCTDATDLRVELPMLTLFPETGEQIVAVVQLAGEMGFGIIPRGGGTGLTGGAIPLARRSVVLSLSRFKEILEVNVEAGIIRVQSGVITLKAIQAAAKRGMLFTVDPASKQASSIGGNVSENSGGPFAFEYGTTIDNLLSWRMVTPTGDLIEVRRRDHPRHKIFEHDTAIFDIYDETGTRTRTVTLRGDQLRGPGLGKDVSDKWLHGLPGVQKEGVDGIILDATFILHPAPKYSRVLCLEFYGRSLRNSTLLIRDVVGLRDTIRHQGDLVKISALEEFGKKYVQAIEYKKKSDRYEGDPISVIIMQLDSDDLDALNQAVDATVALAEPYDGVDIFAARDEREAELFWEDRHKLSAISKRTSGFKINEDVVIPLSIVSEFAHFLEDLNLIYLAKAYRTALQKVRDLPAFPAGDARVEEGMSRAQAILKGEMTSNDVSEDEQQAQIRYVFRELRDEYPRLDREIRAIADHLFATRVEIANHMHAGDGNCHVNLPVNSNDAEMLRLAHEAAEAVMVKVLELGGQVSGEHGIGITKIAFLDEAKIKALRAYKAEVDPKGILNPGKLTQRDLPSESFTFSFNRLIEDLDKTVLRDKDALTSLLRNIQTCTRCGKCKGVCPMYHPSRGLMYHPRNKNISLGALLEAIYYSQVQRGAPDEGLLACLRRIMEHCTACGKCTAVCPVKIDSAGAALKIRAFLDFKGRSGHPLKTMALNYLVKDPSGRLPGAAKLMALGQRANNAALSLLPAFWRKQRENLLLQSPGPDVDFTNLIQELKLDEQCVFRLRGALEDDTVLYFPGCGAGLFATDIALATLAVLLASGVNVVLPPRHLCCGYPLLASGCEEAYKLNRHRTLQELIDLLIVTGKAGLKATTLVTACGTCRESLSTYDFALELKEPLRHLDLMQFVLERLERLQAAAPQSVGGRGADRVIYHAACHAEWTNTSKAKAPELYRQALGRIAGVEAALSPYCCGESGLGALTSPEIYNLLRERKKDQLTRDIAAVPDAPVVVGCPSCRMGIRRCLIQLHKSTTVLHTSEFLAQRFLGSKWKKNFKSQLAAAERHGRTVVVG